MPVGDIYRLITFQIQKPEFLSERLNTFILKTLRQLISEFQISLREIVKSIDQCIHIKSRASCHHKGFMPLIKEPVYQFQGFDFIFPGRIEFSDSVGMYKVMLYRRKLLRGRYSSAYAHLLIYLTGVTGNYRRIIFECSLDAVVCLSYSRRAQQYYQPAIHTINNARSEKDED